MQILVNRLVRILGTAALHLVNVMCSLMHDPCDSCQNLM